MYRQIYPTHTWMALVTDVVSDMAEIQPFRSNNKHLTIDDTEYRLFGEPFGKRRVINRISEHNYD